MTPHATPRAARVVTDMTVATEKHCLFCFDTLAHHFGQVPPPQAQFPLDTQCPLFVTWNKRSPRGERQLQLRGCIGCLSPLPLTSLRDYALTSALLDRRFPPMDAGEFPFLQCTVQLLGKFEPCGLYEWTIGVHGLTISFVDHANGGDLRRSAVYLPDVIPEQRWSQVEAIDSLIRKSGYEWMITEELRASLEVRRFVSTKHSITYERWADLRFPPSPSAAPASMPQPAHEPALPQEHESQNYSARGGV
jgi:uncharacterized protein (TIGR00296 family)